MNSAERLLKIYDRLVSINKESAMRQIWAEVFELNASDVELEDEIVALLTALRKQIDNTSASLTNYDVPNELLHPGFSRFRETASTAHLNSGWNGLRGNIQAPECRQAFIWSSWVLRAENKKELSDEDLIELLNELSDLEQKISETSMSAKLRSFLKDKIVEIKNALFLSKVQGLDAVNDAVEKIVGALATADADIVEEAKKSQETKSVVSMFMDKFEKVAKLSDNVDKVIALGTLLGTGAGALSLFFKG